VEVLSPGDRIEGYVVDAALGLAFRAAKDPDQIVVHQAMTWPEPIDQRLDIELCRSAAHGCPHLSPPKAVSISASTERLFNAHRR